MRVSENPRGGEPIPLRDRLHRELITVNADSLIGDRLSRIWVTRLKLVPADCFTAALVTAEGFDPAQSRWAWGMQDLQHQLVGQEGVGAWALLAAARHRGLEIEIAFESGDLAVGRVGVVLHPQQLLPEQGAADGGGIEAAITNQTTALVGIEPRLVQQRWIVWGIEIKALHLPEPVKPVGIDQVVSIRGPWQWCRQSPLGPTVQPLFQAALSPGGAAAEQDGEADQQHPHAPFHV
mgnify:FL=1